jgi:hypothetical protein
MLLLLLLALQDDSIKFDKSYSAGLKAAKEKGQLVLLYFHQAG